MSQNRTAGLRAFRLRPLACVCLAFAFAAGLSVYVLVGWQMLLFLGVCLLGGLILLLRNHTLMGSVLLALALGFLLVWLCHFDATNMETNWAGETAELTVQVRSYPVETEYSSEIEAVVQTKGDLEGQKLVLYLQGDTAKIKPGDLLTAEIALRSARGESDPWVYAQYSEQVYLTGSVKEWKLQPRDTPWYLIPKVWAKRLSEGLDEILPEEQAGFLRSIAIGDRAALSDDLYSALNRTGLTHISAASGLHVQMLCSVFMLLPGDKRKKGLVLMPLLPLYAALAGFTPSICRAVLMQELVLLASAADRETDGVTSLSLALAVILLQNPLAIASVSLQLSFSAMAGILLVMPKLTELMGDWGILNGVRSSICLSISANVFSLPLVLYYFGYASILGVLSNLLFLWLLPALLPLALLCGFTGWTAPAPLLSVLTELMMGGVKALAKFPYAVFTTDHIEFLIWLGLCCLLGLVMLVGNGKKKQLLVSTAAAALILAGCFWSVQNDYNSGELNLSVLNVGQGQCLLLTAGTETAVVDCGSQNEDSWDVLDLELRQAGRENIDCLILTHYDSDHISGVLELLKNRPVGCLYLPIPGEEDAMAIPKIMALAVGQQIEICFVSETMDISLGETAEITIYVTYSEGETGLALLASADSGSVLITGDADLTGEARLIEAEALPEVTVLVAGHHGSKNATGEDLLDAVNPEQILISVGENSYGHPAEEMLERCGQAGAEIRRTDEEGMISVKIG